jgi:hypothetical protein
MPGGTIGRVLWARGMDVIDACGARALAAYGALSGGARGRLPPLSASPRAAGAAAAGLLVLGIGLLLIGGTLGVRRAVVAVSHRGAGAASGVEYVLRCEKCGWATRQCVPASERERGAGPTRCESCGALSVYREQAGNVCVLSPPARRVPE